MTLVEFIHPLKSSGSRDICLAAMYFHERLENGDPVTVEGLRTLIKRARVSKADKLNLADILAKSAPHVETVGKQGNRFIWRLTSSGQEHVRTLLGLPSKDVEIENDVAALTRLVSAISDTDIVDYLSEAIRCLQVNALRATVVFVWAGAVKKLRDDAFACGSKNVTNAVTKFDPKAKPLTKLDDLVLIKESVLLLALQELGLVDKNQRTVLEDCLDLRNKCGHPGKYKVGQKKVGGFVEDVIGIVFS